MSNKGLRDVKECGVATTTPLSRLDGSFISAFLMPDSPASSEVTSLTPSVG